MTENKLHIYKVYNDLIVAYSETDAREIWCVEGFFPSDNKPMSIEAMDDNEAVTFDCDENGDMLDEDQVARGMTGTPKTLKAAEWAQHYGRGLLSSTEL